jgi:sec-independent protein translocase protein TatB
MKPGMMELLVVFIVALLVIGPDRLPEFARKLGEALGQFKKYSDAATKDIKESIVEPLQEAQKPIREAMEPLDELNRTVKGNVKDVEDSFKDLGKVKQDKTEKKDPVSEDAQAKPSDEPETKPQPDAVQQNEPAQETAPAETSDEKLSDEETQTADTAADSSENVSVNADDHNKEEKA